MARNEKQLLTVYINIISKKEEQQAQILHSSDAIIPSIETSDA